MGFAAGYFRDKETSGSTVVEDTEGSLPSENKTSGEDRFEKRERKNDGKGRGKNDRKVKTGDSSSGVDDVDSSSVDDAGDVGERRRMKEEKMRRKGERGHGGGYNRGQRGSLGVEYDYELSSEDGTEISRGSRLGVLEGGGREHKDRKDRHHKVIGGKEKDDKTKDRKERSQKKQDKEDSSDDGKKDREKEGKKKKKEKKDDESDHEDKKEKKKKKDDNEDEREKRKNKDEDEDEKKTDKDDHEDKKVKNKNKDEDKDEKKKKKEKNKDGKEQKKDKEEKEMKIKPKKLEQNRTLQSKDGKLNFINDSGTQINFWGVPPEEMMEKVEKMFPDATDPLSQWQQQQQQQQQQRQSMMRNSFHPHSSANGRPVLGIPSQPPRRELTDAPRDDSPSTPLGAPPTIAKSKENEQQSIGGFFKKLFKRGDKKEKKADPRSTVQDVDSSGGKSKYDEIRKKCSKQKSLWEDPDFAAETESVYVKEAPVSGDIEWKRPSEICDDPQMFVGGASRFDVKQGVLGNCWLLAAVASLTTNKKLFRKVVPADQSFQNDYGGVFRFVFWQYGRWVEVCVDDRLPTLDGKLIFMHSTEGNEFWSPLLEKAYAKLCGSYENLSGGLASEALTDFTGGVTERYNFREELPDNLFQIMLKATQRGSLLGCSIDANPDQMEEEMDNGLIIGHAYSITDVKLVESDGGAEELVRVRNPWGNDSEWKGAWSDQSDEWQNLSEDVKESLGLQFDHDGEFWMSFKDFSTHFQRLEICHLGPDVADETFSKRWASSVMNGAWKKNVTAGGCRNFPKTFPTNPQYRIQITDVDEDDDEDVGTVIIGLMQLDRRKLRAQGQGNLTMGYELYLTNGKKSLEKDFFKSHRPAAVSAYINMREVCTRHRLPPGEYAIVPTAFEPNEEAAFILRIFSEKESDIVEVDEDTSIVQAQNLDVVHSAPSQSLAAEAERHFRQYGGEDEEVDAFELQNVLNEVFTKDFDFGSFDVNLCRSMIAWKDGDQTGKLALEEFRDLWAELQKWKTIYKRFDADQSGSFNTSELREALKYVGYQLSNATFNTVVMRFSNREGFLSFADFVACAVKLKTMFDIFTERIQEGSVSFTLDEFIQMTVYC